MTASLYDDAELYDAIAPADPVMADFYCHGLAPGMQVLELACGTGRFSLPLAQTGAALVAGDIDTVMLEAARRRLAAVGANAEFCQFDMRGFDLGRHFDRLVIAANSLMHLLETEDLLACLSAIRRHLAPHGELRFDVFVPSVALLARQPGERLPLGKGRFSTSRGEVKVDETISYDPHRQISTADLFWSRDGAADFRVTRLVLRQIFPAELPLLLERSGLRLIARYGDFSGAPFGSGFRQVCICRPD